MSRTLEAQYEARAKRKRQRLQGLLYQLEEWMMAEDTQGMRITHMTVRSGFERGGEFLVTVKAQIEGRLYVAFHSANSPEDAITGALDRARDNALKWREDTPYEG